MIDFGTSSTLSLAAGILPLFIRSRLPNKEKDIARIVGSLVLTFLYFAFKKGALEQLALTFAHNQPRAWMPNVLGIILMLCIFQTAWAIIAWAIKEKGIAVRVLGVGIPLILLPLILKLPFLPPFGTSGTALMPVSFDVYKPPPGFKLPKERVLVCDGGIPFDWKKGELPYLVHVKPGMCFAVLTKGGASNSTISYYLQRLGRKPVDRVTWDAKSWVYVNELSIDRSLFPCPSGLFGGLCLSIASERGTTYQYVPVMEPGCEVLYVRARLEGDMRAAYNIPRDVYNRALTSTDLRLIVYRVPQSSLAFIPKE